MFDRARRRRAERDATAEELAGKTDLVQLSTLAEVAWPYQLVGVITGGKARDPETAFEKLKQHAAELGCDAVLGAGLTSWAGEADTWPRFVAYGTGVRRRGESGF